MSLGAQHVEATDLAHLLGLRLGLGLDLRQRLVPGRFVLLGRLDRVEAGGQADLGGLEVEQLAGHVLLGDLQVVRALPGTQLRMEIARLGIDEVGRERPGIAPEEQKLMFQEFRRGSAAGGQGLGLGLSIAQRMADLLGHQLGLRSWPGCGSVFHLDVSMAQVAVQLQPAASAQQSLPAGRALLLDNEPAALAALSNLLTSWGWLVHAARNAEQALAAPWRPDLHILDFHLDGGHTGLEVWQQLNARHADVPTVMLTADRDGELRQRLLEAGMGVLYKPLKPLALRQVLQRVVAGAMRA